MKQRCIMALWAVVLGMAPIVAQAQSYMTEEGHAEFTSEVPLHTFTGTSEKLTGLINLEDGSIDFYIDLTTFDTGIGKRDKDMRKTLETDKFPFAEFLGTLVTEFDADSDAEQPVTARGNFKIHDVTREIEVTGTLQKVPEGLKLNAAWEINLEDYDIVPPRLLIVKVDPVQDVRIEAVLPPQG